ncbi:retrotransposon protein, putative, ty1-copia subclass [Tanacetum coccineum]
MTGAKFDIEKFDGTGDFGLWRVKMRALLIQNRCEAALEVLPRDMETQAKAELNKKAHSAVILCLGNKVLREVTRETNAATVWSKLKTLYMTKSLAIKFIIRTLCGYLALWTGSFDLGGRDGHTKFKGNQRKDHLKRNCPKNNRKKSTGYVNKDDQPSSSGSIYDSYEVMMVISIEALLDWIMDSGASYHMTPRYIPELKRNLISLGTLKKEGYTIKLVSRKIKVINGSRVVLSGTRRDNCVYSLDGHALAGKLNASVEEKDSLTQGVIDYVHSDLCGPSQLESLGGKRYFLSIVDDYSRRVWVYILRFKHEAFEKFKEWKQLVENQTGRTVKKLRTDNGLEFCNREFKQLCIESKIARHLTVAGTPQQNGLAERMNRTLMDKVRCLLIQSGLPKTFWAEATCTAAYLINRSPSTAIEKKTPMEMWSGHPSDYGMLRTFGCVAYSHVKQGKIESRAVKCILLGYPKGVKGYILYRLDNESPKIVTSRNVVFNESVMYKDTLKDSGAGTDKSVEELQVEVELQGLSNRMPEEDHTDQEDGNDENAGDQETDQAPDLTDYQLVRDREPRIRTIPLRFRDESNMAAYAFAAAEEEDTHEPLTYQEAVACEDSSKWKAAMEEEMDSLRKNKTWELVDHPAGQKLVSCKWLFKIKEGIEGVQRPRYKARLVARGFTQRAGIDYNEVFSPVVRHTSIRVILALTACKDYELE